MKNVIPPHLRSFHNASQSNEFDRRQEKETKKQRDLNKNNNDFNKKVKI